MERLLVSCLVLRFVIYVTQHKRFTLLSRQQTFIQLYISCSGYKTEPSGGRGRAQLVQSCQENVVNMIWDDPIDYETNCKFSKDLLLLLDLVKCSDLFSFVSFKDEKKQNQLTTNSLGKFLLKNELKIVKTKCFWLVISKIIKLILMRHCDY